MLGSLSHNMITSSVNDRVTSSWVVYDFMHACVIIRYCLSDWLQVGYHKSDVIDPDKFAQFLGWDGCSERQMSQVSYLLRRAYRIATSDIVAQTFRLW